MVSSFRISLRNLDMATLPKAAVQLGSYEADLKLVIYGGTAFSSHMKKQFWNAAWTAMCLNLTYYFLTV